MTHDNNDRSPYQYQAGTAEQEIKAFPPSAPVEHLAPSLSGFLTSPAGLAFHNALYFLTAGKPVPSLLELIERRRAYSQ